MLAKICVLEKVEQRKKDAHARLLSFFVQKVVIVVQRKSNV